MYATGDYAARADTVCAMLRLECGESGAEPANMLSLAIRHKGEPIYSFVEENASSLVRNILEDSRYRSPADEESITWVLNNDDLESDLANAFARRLPAGIITSLLSVVYRDVWPSLVEADAISPSPENVLDYITNDGGAFDEPISAFINRHAGIVLGEEDVKEHYGNVDAFVKRVLEAEHLNPDRARKMVEHLKGRLEEFYGQVDGPTRLLVTNLYIRLAGKS